MNYIKYLNQLKHKAMKTKTKNDTFEMFYNFCGDFDDMLQKQYKKTKIKDKGVTFPQFCITVFANMIDEANEVLNIKK